MNKIKNGKNLILFTIDIILSVSSLSILLFHSKLSYLTNFVEIFIILSVSGFSYFLTFKYSSLFSKTYVSYYFTPIVKYYITSLSLLYLTSLLGLTKISFLTIALKINFYKIILDVILFLSFYLFIKGIKQKKSDVETVLRKANVHERLSIEVQNVHNQKTITILIDEFYQNKSTNISNLISRFDKKKNNNSIRILDAENILFGVQHSKEYDVIFLESKLNYMCDIQKFLATVYNSLVPGGFFIFILEDEISLRKKICKSNWNIINKIRLLIYSIMYTVLPKLPLIINVYKYIRLYKEISLIELDGRIIYHGFEKYKVINNHELNLYVIRKMSLPIQNFTPSYKFLVKLNRVGYQGEIILIYKLRSMFPYSEFLQKKVYEANELNNSGKFKHDYRITRIGAVIRKYWIDEVPQILNWFRGDIKLVGIRAMSLHYFGLYPDYYQKKYFKVKPGLIPPLFDEKTDGFEEIMNIELEYLESYAKNRIKADFNLLLETMRKIVFYKTRSK